MNVLLGFCGSGAAPLADRGVEYLNNTYAAKSRRCSNIPCELALLFDGGAVAAHFADATLGLSVLGHPAGLSPLGADCARRLADRYRRHGTAFLDGLPGHYAVAVCDAEHGKLMLGADPLGLRTLYYYVSPDETSFAYGSNLRALAAVTGSISRLDRSLEDFFLIYGFLPWQRTPYQGVRAVPPGTLLEWSAGSITSHQIRSSSVRASEQPLARLPEPIIVRRLYETFMACVEEQASESADAAVLLGGVDSALVAAALHRLGKRVTTYSFSYADQRFDQPHTDTLVRHLRHEHHWVRIGPRVIAQGLQTYATVFNQPTNWPNYVIQTDYLCAAMREAGHQYCYSGDGCDALFMGYPSVARRARLVGGRWRLPKPALRILIGALGRYGLELRLGQVYRIGFNLLRLLTRSMPERGHLTFRIFDETSLPRLRNYVQAPPQDGPIDELLARLARGLDGMSPLRLAYLGKAAVSPNRAKIVGSEDHNGVIIQSPYLHPALRAFAVQLPDSLFRPKAEAHGQHDIGKYVLAKMAQSERLLPDEVIYQPKLAAIASPIDQWYANELRTTAEQMLKGLPFAVPQRYLQSLLADLTAERLYKKYLSTDQVTSHAISLLATYASFTAAPA
jgi:asparagine synthase (glutamine-hydrolysing)